MFTWNDEVLTSSTNVSSETLRQGDAAATDQSLTVGSGNNETFQGDSDHS